MRDADQRDERRARAAGRRSRRGCPSPARTRRRGRRRAAARRRRAARCATGPAARAPPTRPARRTPTCHAAVATPISRRAGPRSSGSRRPRPCAGAADRRPARRRRTAPRRRARRRRPRSRRARPPARRACAVSKLGSSAVGTSCPRSASRLAAPIAADAGRHPARRRVLLAPRLSLSDRHSAEPYAPLTRAPGESRGKEPAARARSGRPVLTYGHSHRPKTTEAATPLSKRNRGLKRRGRDSNPRCRGYPHNGFRDRPIQPLSHPSGRALGEGSDSASPGGEEVQSSAAHSGCEDAAGDGGAVVEARLGEDVEDDAGRARLGVGGAVDDARDAGRGRSRRRTSRTARA